MANLFQEYGRIGQNRWQGFINEEFLPELRGKKGIKVYEEMSQNDSVIGAILYAVEMLVRQVSWTIEPAGTTKQDKAAAEFLTECMDDMDANWTDIIAEILTFLTYGWSAHEIVYKRRLGRNDDPRKNSKYDDGLIAWRKIPIRSQDTLYEWQFDEETDDLIGLTQQPPPHYEMISIPLERLLLFRTTSNKDNPEGRSILRTAYRSWYFKKRIEEIEGIGIERDLAGLPIMIAPEDMDIWSQSDSDMTNARNAATNIVTNIRRDSQEGIVLPYGWDLKLLSTGGRRNFDTNAIIERYDTRIAMTVLADFILLGHQAVGSFALSSDKTELFSVALGTYLDVITQEFNNKAIPKLIEFNKEHFNNLTDYPELEHGDIETPNLSELGSFIKDMAGVGLITPDESMEDYLRSAASLPEKKPGAVPKTPIEAIPEPEQELKETGGEEDVNGTATEK